MKKMMIVAALLLAAARASAGADWLMRAQAEHDARKAQVIAERLHALNPALAAMMFEMENIDGRRRAGSLKEGDLDTYAEIVKVLMMSAEDTVKFSNTVEGARFFHRWQEWAKKNKQFIKDWGDSL